jgi:hypothetical protein
LNNDIGHGRASKSECLSSKQDFTLASYVAMDKFVNPLASDFVVENEDDKGTYVVKLLLLVN